MSLTDTKIRNAKPGDKPQRISDGGGLYLQINPNGSKLWRMNYRFGEKQKTLAFGKYPQISLVEARNARENAKKLLAAGEDPSAERKAEKTKAKLARGNTFEVVAGRWFEEHKEKWRRKKTQDEAFSVLKRYIFPKIGDKPIAEIEPPTLLTAIREIQDLPHKPIRTARDAGLYSSQVFRFAIAEGIVNRDPYQDIKGALRKAPPKQNHKALPTKDLPGFFHELAVYRAKRPDRERITLAFELLIHTLLRRQEVLGARWSEFEDLEGDAPLWRIPEERMKNGREHTVPLSPQVLAIIRRLRELCADDSEFVFPDKTRNGIVCLNILRDLLVIFDMKDKADVHGFRITASTVLNEQSQFDGDWIERALSHVDGNGVRATYNKAQYLSQRREMLCWWSDYLDKSKTEGQELFALIG